MGDPLVEGVRLAMGMGLLSFAAIKDLRSRIVPDMVWMMMGTVGFVLMVYDLLYLGDFSWPLLAAIVGVYLVLLDFLLPRPEIFPETGKPNLLAAILPAAGWGMLIVAAVTALEDCVAPVMSGCIIAFVYVMYRLGYITGGADAKALMAISVLVPMMPETAAFPVIPTPEGFGLFPFVILAFIYSGVIHIALVPYYGIKNAIKGDFRFPQMLIGYRMDVGKVEGSFVWPLERVEGGAHVIGLRHFEQEDFDASALRKMGRDRVWVTPQHPGILFLFMGFLLAFLAGNPFLLLVG